MKYPVKPSRTRVDLPAVLVACSLLAAMLSCTPMEEAASLWIHNNIKVTQQEQCVARSDARVMRSRGILDTWVRNNYFMFPKLENYLLSTRAAFGELYGENHNVQIMGAHVSYEYPSGLAAATVTALSGSRFIAAAGSVQPTELGVTTFPAIPTEVGNVLAVEPAVRGGDGIPLLVKVRIEGRLADGTIVKSNEFQYPVDICFGCLYMVVSDDCTNLSDAQDMRPPCIIGQDDGVDCRLFTLWGVDADDRF